MGTLWYKAITCQNREISRYVASKSHMLFNYMITAEISRRIQLNALRMVAYRQPQGIVWRSTSDWYKGHPALTGFSLPYVLATSSRRILAFISNNTFPTTASQDHCTKLTYLIYNRQCTLSFPLYGLRSLGQPLHLQAIGGLKKCW